MLAQLINAMLGIWLMAAPTILGYGGPARPNHQIVGPPGPKLCRDRSLGGHLTRALGQFRARPLAPARIMDVHRQVGSITQ